MRKLKPVALMQIPNFIYGAAVGGVAVSNGLSNLFLFAFIPIFYRIYTSESIFSAIKIGAVAGWAYGLVSLLWLSTPVDVLGAPPIVGYLVWMLVSAMYAVIGIAVAFISYGSTRQDKKPNFLGWFIFSLSAACGWGLFEFLITEKISGLPLMILASVAASGTIARHFCSYLGVYGVSSALVFLSLLPLMALYINAKYRFIIALIGALPLMVFCYDFDRAKMERYEDKSHQEQLVQVNIIQEKDFYVKKEDPIHEFLKIIKNEKMEGEGKVKNLILFPENTVNKRAILLNQKLYQSYLEQEDEIISGANWGEAGNGNINAIIKLNKEGVYPEYYKALHVPLGEFNPLSTIFPSLDNYLVGKYEQASIKPDKNSIWAYKICWEIIFSDLDPPAASTRALINPTNEEIFGGGYRLAEYLFSMSRLQAAAWAIPVLRVSKVGLSAVIDAHGNVISFAEKGSQSLIIKTSFTTKQFESIYKIYGSWLTVLIQICLICLLYLLSFAIKIARNTVQASA